MLREVPRAAALAHAHAPFVLTFQDLKSSGNKNRWLLLWVSLKRRPVAARQESTCWSATQCQHALVPDPHVPPWALQLMFMCCRQNYRGVWGLESDPGRLALLLQCTRGRYARLLLAGGSPEQAVVMQLHPSTEG